MRGVLTSHKSNRFSMAGMPWMGSKAWGRELFRSLHSQEWNPAALYFLSQTLDPDLPWLLFQCRCFQPSVSAKALDASHRRGETPYILYIFHICVEFKLCGNLCHWTPHHSWPAGDISDCGQECLEVEMEIIFLLIQWYEKKFGSNWTIRINPPKAWRTVLLSKF